MVGAKDMLVPSLPGDWRGALRAIAQHTRQAFVNHPWLLLTLQDRPRVSPNLLRHIEQSAQAVASLGATLEPRTLNGIVMAVDDYTVGYTLRELASADPGDRARGIAKRFREESEEPYVRYLLESGEFPMLSRFLTMDGEPSRHRPPEWKSHPAGVVTPASPGIASECPFVSAVPRGIA